MIMRPKQFYLASLALFAIALSFPVQVMVLYGHKWNESSAIFGKITTLNWMVMLSLVVGAYLYFHASRLIVFVAPVILALVALNNYLVGQFAGDFSLLQTTLGTLAIALIFSPLLLPSSQVVLRDPTRRWWRCSPRVRRQISATLNPYVGDMIQAKTFDISKTGVFISLDESVEHVPKVGDKIRLSFNVNSMKKVRCEAVVVRHSEASGKYPKGLGLQFVEVNKKNEKGLQDLLV